MSLPTKERLARVLHAAGLFVMEGAARDGKYDDYETESTTPITDLMRDLTAAGRPDLAERAKQGEWDGTAEEGLAWFEREGKDLLP